MTIIMTATTTTINGRDFNKVSDHKTVAAMICKHLGLS